MERQSSSQPTTQAMRGALIALHEDGKTNIEISQQLGMHRTTVARWISRYYEEGNLETKRKSGRPRCTTLLEDNDIGRLVEEHPINTTHFIPAYKPKLTQQHKEERLGFTLEYLAKDDEFWAKVIFTDEKTFSSEGHSKRHCWRLRETRYEEKNICESQRSGRINVGMLGWISGLGIGELTEVNGRFTSEQYIEILEEVMLPSVRAMVVPEPENIYFVQDRSPIHTSGVVKQWLVQHPEIVLLNFPPKSPDLNPIENIWGIIMQEWTPQNINSRENLLRHSKDVGEGIRRRPNICQRMSNSMADRLDLVINAEGSHTKY
ncbi:unnamed protein product [Rotaria magnacalcarata]|uniref:Tc1-like transposase DDE domain-containing protein n=1 Tax=Rotaria magnacalcarata TaxID=392030 RepID=A0A816QER1_9BILA|nr:unnamed protein product [Rotaria magnacalcarata]